MSDNNLTPEILMFMRAIALLDKDQTDETPEQKIKRIAAQNLQVPTSNIQSHENKSGFMFLGKAISKIEPKTREKLLKCCTYIYFSDPLGLTNILKIDGKSLPDGIDPYDYPTNSTLIFDKDSVNRIKELYGDEFYNPLIDTDSLINTPLYVINDTESAIDSETLNIATTIFANAVKIKSEKFKQKLQNRMQNNNQLLLYTILLVLSNKIPDDMPDLNEIKNDTDILIQYFLDMVKKYYSEKNDSTTMQSLIENLFSKLIISDALITEFTKNFDELGKIKTESSAKLSSVKLSVVTLENGNFIQTDFSKLDPNKKYTICHNIDITKAKIPFDFSKITVLGNFSCASATRFIKLPHEISGKLDCSVIKNMIDNDGNKIDFITPNTTFPVGTTSVDLSYTINDFSILLSMPEFPETLTEIIVQTSLLNKINDKNPEIKNQACEFIKKHPDITVTDGKKTLREKLNELNSQQQTTNNKQQTTKKEQTQHPTIPLKDNKDLSRDEICTRLRAENNEIINSILDDEKLKDIIRTVSNANNAIIHKYNRSKDGNDIPCIHSSEYLQLRDFIIKYITEQTKKQINSAPTPQPKIPTNNTPTTSIQSNTVTETKVVAFISKQCLKSLSKSINQSDLLQMLSTADSIILPRDAQTVQIKDPDGKLIIAPNFDVKRPNTTLAQAPSSKDRKRLMWNIYYYNETTIIVANNFFEDHTGNNIQINLYKNNINDTNTELPQDIKFFLDGTPDKKSCYINVADWLSKNIKTTKTNTTEINPEPVNSDGTNTQPTLNEQEMPAKQVTQDTPQPVITDPGNSVEQTKKSGKRPRIKRVSTAPVSPDPLGDTAVKSSSQYLPNTPKTTSALTTKKVFNDHTQGQEMITPKNDFIRINTIADLDILKKALKGYIDYLSSQETSEYPPIIQKTVENEINLAQTLHDLPGKSYHCSYTPLIKTALDLFADDLNTKFQNEKTGLQIGADTSQITTINAQYNTVNALQNLFNKTK